MICKIHLNLSDFGESSLVASIQHHGSIPCKPLFIFGRGDQRGLENQFLLTWYKLISSPICCFLLSVCGCIYSTDVDASVCGCVYSMSSACRISGELIAMSRPLMKMCSALIVVLKVCTFFTFQAYLNHG